MRSGSGRSGGLGPVRRIRAGEADVPAVSARTASRPRASPGGTVVSNAQWPAARGRFDHHEVEPEWEMRDRRAIRKDSTIEQSVRGRSNADPLAVIDGLLGQAEITTASPAHLDDHERRGRPRIHGHQVELMAADVEVPTEDGPARFGEPCGDHLLRRVSRTLCRSARRSASRGARRSASRGARRAGPIRLRVGSVLIGSTRVAIHRDIVPADALPAMHAVFPGAYPVASSSSRRSSASSAASSAMTGTSSRSSISCVEGDAAGSASRSSSS